MKTSLDIWQYVKGALAEVFVIELCIQAGLSIKRNPWEYDRKANKITNCDFSFGREGKDVIVEVKFVDGDRIQLSRINESTAPRYLAVVRLRDKQYLDVKVFENCSSKWSAWIDQNGLADLKEWQTTESFLPLNNNLTRNAFDMLGVTGDLFGPVYNDLCTRFARVMVAATA